MKLTDTIKDVKEQYFNKGGNKANTQWIFNARVLKNEDVIKNLEIEELDYIEAHPSYRG